MAFFIDKITIVRINKHKTNPHINADLNTFFFTTNLTLTLTNKNVVNEFHEYNLEKLIDNFYPSSIICHMNLKQEIEKIILAIELASNKTGDTLNDCFMSFVGKGYEINFIAKDLGNGLEKGVDLMNENEVINIISQADLFHLLIRFNQPLASLEKKAYGAIEEEEKRIKTTKN